MVLIVPRPGLEPGWVAPLVFETSASTDSAIWARNLVTRMVQTESRKLALCRGAAHPRSRILSNSAAKVRISEQKTKKKHDFFWFYRTKVPSRRCLRGVSEVRISEQKTKKKAKKWKLFVYIVKYSYLSPRKTICLTKQYYGNKQTKLLYHTGRRPRKTFMAM